MPRYIFRSGKFECQCGEQFEQLHWEHEPNPTCPKCGGATEQVSRFSKLGASPAMHGDEMDVMIRHGVCNDDGTPRRFRSKEELKRAAFEAGYTYGTETPRVNQRIVEEREAARAERDRRAEKG